MAGSINKKCPRAGCALRISGFSLVELSIVLLILGLLTGGVLAGSALIEAAELRQVIKESERYRLALNNFRLRYNALPGDFRQAQKLWGVADADAGNCAEMDKTGMAGVCNGNGDRQIGGGGADTRVEPFFLWRHLQHAGLIEGSFSGTWDPDCASGWCYDAYVPGFNSPVSHINENSGWSVVHKGVSLGDENRPNWFVGEYGHALMLGATMRNAAPLAPLFTPGQTHGIDEKLDDGLPARGQIVVRAGNYPDMDQCTETLPGSGEETTNSDLDSVYRLSHDGVSCNLIMRNVL